MLHANVCKVNYATKSCASVVKLTEASQLHKRAVVLSSVEVMNGITIKQSPQKRLHSVPEGLLLLDFSKIISSLFCCECYCCISVSKAEYSASLSIGFVRCAFIPA